MTRTHTTTTRREAAAAKAARIKASQIKAARRALQLQFDCYFEPAAPVKASIAWSESGKATPIRFVTGTSQASGWYQEACTKAAAAAAEAAEAAARTARKAEQAARAPWEQLWVLLKAQYGLQFSITAAEWKSRQLDAAKAKALGLRSPKLSKALVALGVPAPEVSLLLGATKTVVTAAATNTDTWVSSDLEDLWDQGNSIHYSSCQVTDSRAAWGGDTNWCDIAAETKHLGKHLFLWVTGQRMSIDGTGFTARAKLRVLYYDAAATEIAGLYIDRPYGAAGTLKAGLAQLAEWWATRSPTPIFMPTTWERRDGAGNDFQYQYGGLHEEKLYSPSSTSGYQDTCTQGAGPYDFMVPVAQHGSLIRRAFTARPKEGNVYLLPLAAVKYNPQTDKFTVPKVATRSARRPITESYRYVRSLAVSFGLTDFKYVGQQGVGYGTPTIIYQAGSYKFYVYEGLMPCIALTDNKGHLRYCTWEEGRLTVREDNLELGLVVSQSLPYEYNASERSLTVSAEEYWCPDVVRDYGFMKAEELPYTHDSKELRVVSETGDFELAIELPYTCSPGLLVVVHEPKRWYKAVALDKSNISANVGHVYIKDHEDFLVYHKLLWAEKDILWWNYI
jgi:hypothetical protein